MLDDSLPTVAAARIDALCTGFEAALNEGRCPDIEEYVQQADTADRDLLRRELERIGTDFERRRDLEADVLSEAITTQPVGTTPSNASPPPEPSQTAAYTPGDLNPDARHPVAMTSFDRYQVRGILGKGGFGLVYRGFDPELRRDVAIKVPIGAREASSSQVEAYLAEARIVASLDHPGIVPVYDVGRTESGCFVVSKYVAGNDLAKWMARRRPAARGAAEIVAQVAEALDHAHQRGLVHRDIKPANILIDESGRPLVADFGLALCDDSFGRGAGVCGTPAYMSPEQAAGKSDRVDARSDIYSLGVVFYELLTGRRPYRHSEDWADLIDEIISTEIRPPRQLDHSIPPELERICLRALAKRVGDRYTTAHDLADDLRRFLKGTAPAERNESPVEKPSVLPRTGRLKVGLGLAASTFAACGLALAANAFFAKQPVARFDRLELKVGRIRESRAIDEELTTYSLVDDGQNVAMFPEDRLTPDKAFKLEGRFEVPCFWRLLWLDTRGRWSMADAPARPQPEFFYPLKRTMVPVAPEDPPGTHLLVVVASDKPIGEQLSANLIATPPPSLERLTFWSNSEAATLRGAGRELETIDSYLASLAARLPDDQKLVAALFVPAER